MQRFHPSPPHLCGAAVPTASSQASTTTQPSGGGPTPHLRDAALRDGLQLFQVLGLLLAAPLQAAPAHRAKDGAASQSATRDKMCRDLLLAAPLEAAPATRLLGGPDSAQDEQLAKAWTLRVLQPCAVP